MSWNRRVELTQTIHASRSRCYAISFFFTMAEVHSCQDLSNLHIVIWWSNLGATEVARDLLMYTDHCLQSLKENALKGARKEHQQGWIHDNPVADGWAGAVMQKPLVIQKCDRPTDRHGKV